MYDIFKKENKCVYKKIMFYTSIQGLYSSETARKSIRLDNLFNR